MHPSPFAGIPARQAPEGGRGDRHKLAHSAICRPDWHARWCPLQLCPSACRIFHWAPRSISVRASFGRPGMHFAFWFCKIARQPLDNIYQQIRRKTSSIRDPGPSRRSVAHMTLSGSTMGRRLDSYRSTHSRTSSLTSLAAKESTKK